MNEAQLSRIVKAYFIERGLTWPNTIQAMMFAETEMAEAYELLLASMGTWKRNNPENKPEWSPYDFGEELGDAIMMLIVAGLTVGVDPIEDMLHKIGRKAPDALKNT